MIKIDFRQTPVGLQVLRVIPPGQIELQDHFLDQTHLLQHLGPGQVEGGVPDLPGLAADRQGSGLVVASLT